MVARSCASRFATVALGPPPILGARGRQQAASGAFFFLALARIELVGAGGGMPETSPQALQLLDQVRSLALQVANPASRARNQVRDALRDLCRARGLLTSTTETTASRGTQDGYRGRLALVVGLPTRVDGRGVYGPPLALVAVEINRRKVRQRSIFKLLHIPKDIPICSLLILTAGTSPPMEGLDSVLCLGAASIALNTSRRTSPVDDDEIPF